MEVILFLLVVSLVWSGCAGYNLTSCGSDGKVDVDEFRPTVLTCTDITEDTVTWTFRRHDGTNITVASCTWTTSGQNCRATYARFDVERTDYNTSTLNVSLNGDRSYRGVMKCSGPSVQSDSDTCNMRIVYAADAVTNCSVTVDSKDWTVTARCEVDKMFASDGHYSCHWTLPTDIGNESRVGSLSTTSFKENNRDYKKGNCSVTGVAMPTAEGVHSYTVTIDPGVAPLSGPTLDIKQPGNPTLANCPDPITEGININCACQASSSSPPAVVTWYPDLPNPISVLQLNNVNSSMDGTNYTCTQYWGGRSDSFLKRINYTLRVQSTPDTTPNGQTRGDSNNTNDNSNDNNNKDEGLPIPIIAGGAGGGLVVIIIIVIVVVCVVVRRRGGSIKQPTKRDARDDDFEEHINSIYESSDARPYTGTPQLLSSQPPSSPDSGKTTTVLEESETAFGYSAIKPIATVAPAGRTEQPHADLYSTPEDNSPEQHAQNLHADLYSTPEDNSPEQHAQNLHADLNSTPEDNGAKPTLPVTTAGQPSGGDVYAVVNKTNKTKASETAGVTSDVYAVVDKTRSRRREAKGQQGQVSADSKPGHAADHVYSQVNKATKQK